MQLSSLDPARPSELPMAMGRAVTAFAGAGCVASALFVATAAYGQPVAVGNVLIGSLGETWSAFTDWVSTSYARAPALVLGLAALVAVPPLALVGYFLRSRDMDDADISQLETKVHRSSARTGDPEPRDGVRTGHIALRPLNAWVEILNKDDVAPDAEARYGLERILVLRLGRESDNDVQLVDKTVHRYHAAIHRTEDAEFVITDLSSANGNGVVVNGRAVAEARLSNGDTIELGIAKLKFTTAPAV